MESSFQDIRITGLDTNKSQNLPAQNGKHRLYLTLSCAPPGTWRDIFDRERRTQRIGGCYDVVIDGIFLVITCTPEELEKNQLAFLKKDVKNTNEQFKLSIKEDQDQVARFRQSEEERKKQLEAVRDRLKFD